MIGVPDPHCHTCNGICKCGVYLELPRAVSELTKSNLKIGKFIKKLLLEGTEFQNLRRWALEHKSPYGQLYRAMQAQINPNPIIMKKETLKQEKPKRKRKRNAKHHEIEQEGGMELDHHRDLDRE